MDPIKLLQAHLTHGGLIGKCTLGPNVPRRQISHRPQGRPSQRAASACAPEPTAAAGLSDKLLALEMSCPRVCDDIALQHGEIAILAKLAGAVTHEWNVAPMSTFTSKSMTPTARTSRPVELCRRGELRVEKFLDAATDVFTEKGYQQARLSEIVARAGGSLATLYRAFGDKEGLAFAIVERRLQNMAAELALMELDGLPPQQALRKAARSITSSLTTRDAYLVNRIVIGEGRAFPELRDWFFDNAVATIHNHLGHYFEQQVAAGAMVLHTTTNLAATQFFMMLFGDLTIRTACGHMENPDSDDILAFIDGSVDQFLHGALPR